MSAVEPSKEYPWYDLSYCQDGRLSWSPTALRRGCDRSLQLQSYQARVSISSVLARILGPWRNGVIGSPIHAVRAVIDAVIALIAGVSAAVPGYL
jgi:hypothetical protein